MIVRPNRKKDTSAWKLITFALVVLVVFLLRGGNNHDVQTMLSSIHSDAMEAIKSVNAINSTSTIPTQEETRDDSDFELARHESLGFFTDVPSKEWKIRKQITKEAEHHLKGFNPNQPLRKPAAWYQNHWDPDFSCAYEVSVGGMGEGHKWVCDPHRLPEDCLVYSVGSNGNFRFEEALNKLAPQCEIHTFDPTDHSTKMERLGVKANYHTWGIKESYTSDRSQVFENFSKRFENQLKLLTFKTLQDTIAELGHSKRRIDIFKIDCEGCEWRTYKDWINKDVDLRQVYIEVHNFPPIANTMFEDIHKAGFVIFHKEPNIQWSDGNCVEYSFLRLHPDFFGFETENEEN